MEKEKTHEHKEGAHKVSHIDHPAHSSSKGFDKTTIVMMVLVGLLLLVSIVQSVELLGLKSDLSDESLTLSKASSKTSIATTPGSSGGALSKNLESLPSMVGGC